MPITLYHDAPPSQTVGNQILKLVEDNVTDLSMLSVPPSNLLYDIYRWALPVEVGAYMQRIGAFPNEPVELLVAFDETNSHEMIGFLLYSPVPSHSEACGINYMAVRQSHRRRGIGSELIKTLIARYPHVELTCTVKKVSFYESLGFQILDSHSAQVVMNTQSESSPGLMATLNVAPIYESDEARAIHYRLVQRWGHREMVKAEKQLARHYAQLERQSRAFVEARLKTTGKVLAQPSL
jgi:GNAT superfamily N-acetyltransferase